MATSAFDSSNTIYEGAPTTVYAHPTGLASGMDRIGRSGGALHRAILEVDLVGTLGVDAGATIDSASITITVNEETRDPTQDILLARVERTTVPAQLTWNEYASGLSWTTAGGLGLGDANTVTTVATPAPGPLGPATPITWPDSAGLRAILQEAMDDAGGVLRLIVYSPDIEAQGESNYHIRTAAVGQTGEPTITVTWSAGANATPGIRLPSPIRGRGPKTGRRL